MNAEQNVPQRPAGPVVPARFVVSMGKPRRVGQDAAPPGPADAGPKIELVQDNGVIRAIDIICACGERMRINCGY